MTTENQNRWQHINIDTGEKTWLTPRRIIDALGHFDTDPCCPDVMPWRTADRMITKAEDGLKTPWIGRVWLNPPYGREAIPFHEIMANYDGGGVSFAYLRGQTRTPGSGLCFRARTRFSSSKVGFGSARQTERTATAQRLLLRSSLTHRLTRRRSSKAASRDFS